MSTIINTSRHTIAMQEIISKHPTWIMRWGVMLCIAVLVMLGCLSGLIKYPEFVNAGVILRSWNKAHKTINVELTISADDLNLVMVGQKILLLTGGPHPEHTHGLKGEIEFLNKIRLPDGRFAGQITLFNSRDIPISNATYLEQSVQSNVRIIVSYRSIAYHIYSGLKLSK
jgi:hypothetical protein